MVFYRTYRPQNISELDSIRIQETLYAVLSKDVPHAFLFTGPKGLGKTSAARIVAKSVNCEKKNKKNVEPCNACEQCLSITNGTNLDIMEIDAASNRGIDEIRELRDKIRLSPIKASKKVYIIDEVHMLTTEAFNALLKTLEEPPKHVLFILCTTEPHKIPATILSRCFHLQFELATSEELKRAFQRIASEEKMDIDEKALTLLARLAEGSFRDGVKVLEEISILSGNRTITKELIEKKYQVSNTSQFASQILELLYLKNTKKALLLISKMTDQGVNIKFVIEQLIQALHGELLQQIGVVTKFKIQNSKFKIDDIKKLMELLNHAHADMKYAVIPQLPLEMVIIEYTINSLEVSGNIDSQSQKNADTNAEQSRNDIQRSSVSSSAKFSASNDIWYKLLDEIKKHSHTLAGVLRSCKFQLFEDGKLVIEAQAQFHMDKLTEKKSLELIQEAASNVSGNPIEVSVVLKK